MRRVAESVLLPGIAHSTLERGTEGVCMPAYTILDHPSDLGIEARGASLVQAFQNAAIALMSIILDPSAVEPRESREVAVSGIDHEQLLVKWLSEILYLYDGQGFVCGTYSVRQLTQTELRATVLGETFSRGRHSTRMDVKAVTYHQLLVQENETGALVRVFLDI